MKTTLSKNKNNYQYGLMLREPYYIMSELGDPTMAEKLLIQKSVHFVPLEHIHQGVMD
jgi:hypothetical protein